MFSINSFHNFTFLDNGKTVMSKISKIKYKIGKIDNDNIYLVNINRTPKTNKLYYFILTCTASDLINNFLWEK